MFEGIFKPTVKKEEEFNANDFDIFTDVFCTSKTPKQEEFTKDDFDCFTGVFCSPAEPPKMSKSEFDIFNNVFMPKK